MCRRETPVASRLPAHCKRVEEVNVVINRTVLADVIARAAEFSAVAPGVHTCWGAGLRGCCVAS
jgi:hypothetical protein